MIHEGLMSKFVSTSANFEDGNNIDLKLSVGACEVKLKLIYIYKHFYGKQYYYFRIFVTVSDTYDFHKLTLDDQNLITALINNQFGYIPQQNSLLIPYEWSISFDFYRLLLKSEVWGVK